MKFSTLTMIGLLTFGSAGAAIADGHATEKELRSAVTARQAAMQLYNFNLAVLGNMAKGDVAYDAAAAQDAADNLAVLTSMSQRGYWLPGTDSDSLEGSRALPAIWQEGSKAGEIGAQLAEAAVAMQAVASDGVEAIQANMRGVGGACGACHEDYRKSR